MEVTAKVLREVEFRDRLRGYDTDEVDEFLEKVAVGVDALNARVEELETRLAARPQQAEPATVVAPAAPAAPAMDDDAIRRTLVLAQRTADLAIGEAREEAARLVEDAKAEAEGLVARAEEAARHLRAEAEQEVQERVNRLDEERERLEHEVGSLARLVDEERARLTESLTSALRYVRETLAVGDETARRAVGSVPGSAPPPGVDSGERDEPAGTADVEVSSEEEPRPGSPARAEEVTPPPPVQPELPDVEAEVHEDAASAAWTPRSESGGGHVSRPRPIGPRAAEPSDDADAEEALWERWAAGRDLGVVPGPADFSRHPTGTKAQRDRGWSA